MRVRHIRGRINAEIPQIAVKGENSGKDFSMYTRKSTAKPAAKPSTEKTLPFFEKYMLTTEEACVCFHIEEKKMDEIVRDHAGAKWMLYSGKRIMIKKDLFAKWLDQQSAI